MTAAELIAILETVPPDAQVMLDKEIAYVSAHARVTRSELTKPDGSVVERTVVIIE